MATEDAEAGDFEVMDFSEKFIDMCRKATEIQKGWQPEVGDFNTFGNLKGICVITKYELDALNARDLSNVDPVWGYVVRVYGGHFVDHFHECREEFVWLIRQDQLQGMLPWNYMETFNRFYAFTINDEIWHKNHSAKIDKTNKLGGEFHTLEQLWLAFTMHELYKKEWNGEDWE